MADRTITDRLQPSLLDRLTDNAPETQTEARDERVIDIRRLREIIQRDLSWLLNTNNRDSLLDPEIYPQTRMSVLNYGLREVSGEYTTKERTRLIRVSIGEAIERFEPRINRGSTVVEERHMEKGNETTISFDIRAEIWAEPLPLELYLRSEVDVVSGELKLERTG